MPSQLIPIPELSKEARANLMLEVLMYLENFQERIWARSGPTAGVADLLRAIAKGHYAESYHSTWLQQVLRKMPSLWERTRPYYERRYSEA